MFEAFDLTHDLAVRATRQPLTNPTHDEGSAMSICPHPGPSGPTGPPGLDAVDSQTGGMARESGFTLW